MRSKDSPIHKTYELHLAGRWAADDAPITRLREPLFFPGKGEGVWSAAAGITWRWCHALEGEALRLDPYTWPPHHGCALVLVRNPPRRQNPIV